MVAGLVLAAVGFGCGQFSAVTTVERGEDGEHTGTWTIDLTLDERVFEELQALSPEPIDLEYRASMFSEAGWEAMAGTSGISARRTFSVPDELNSETNPLVMLFAGDEGQPPEDNLVRWTEIEIDETDPNNIKYRWAAEVFVPEVDPDAVLEQIVLTLSAGSSDTILPTQTEKLKDALVAAGPFALQMTVNLPGEVDSESIRGGGSRSGPGSVSWHLEEPGSYLLEATSVLAPGDSTAPGSVAGDPSEEDPEDGDTTAAVTSTEGKQKGSNTPQKAGAVVLGLIGAYIAVTGARGVVIGAATALSPGLMVVIGVVTIGGAVFVWNYGPPDLPPSPVAAFIETVKRDVKALEKSSLRGLTEEEARELGFELEKLSPELKKAVSEQLGVEYQTLIEALKDAKEHPEYFE